MRNFEHRLLRLLSHCHKLMIARNGGSAALNTSSRDCSNETDTKAAAEAPSAQCNENCGNCGLPTTWLSGAPRDPNPLIAAGVLADDAPPTASTMPRRRHADARWLRFCARTALLTMHVVVSALLWLRKKHHTDYYLGGTTQRCVEYVGYEQNAHSVDCHTSIRSRSGFGKSI
jgi:hypothetical protein